MGTSARIAIVGAGPCGLACARELERLGYEHWHLYEQDAVAGGHAGSVVDSAGFTWDFGGHVVFSHYGEFDALLVEAMGAELYEHERISYVHFEGTWVPYPFQNNLRHLPPETAYECLVGLIDAPGGDPAMDFGAWIEATFGDGIARHFMRPYNVKVWATPPEAMASTWIAERVSLVDHRRALRSVVLGEDDVGWGPNSTFRYPARGGTGEIYRRVADRLGPRVEYGRELVAVDAARRRITFADGSSEEYDALVTTLPLDRLVAAIADCPSTVRAARETLEHNGVAVVGVGVEAPLRDEKCWMYFPDPEVPFYRATNFAKYSPANVPHGDVGRYTSYMTEISYSPYRPLDRHRLEERVVASLVAAGLVEADASLASLHVIDAPYAYPLPTLGRDRALATIQPWLTEQRIYSRGRFGSWRYELGNMDHAVKMGIDVARLLAEGRPEEVWGA